MSLYRVEIERVEYQLAVVEVEADNEEEARELASYENPDFEVINADECYAVELLESTGKDEEEEEVA